MSDWWAGLPETEARVTCSGAAHTLRWQAGRLQAVDHVDIEGERTLAALGGQRCTCVDVLDAWARHADDLRVLTLASRGPADQLAVRVDWPGSRGRGRGRHPAAASSMSGWTAYAPLGLGLGGWEQVEDELVPLLGLGGGVGDRLVAGVAAAWAVSDGERSADADPRLTPALYGRVLAVLRGWLGEPELEIELERVGRDDARTVERLDEGRLRVRLPFAWLAEVWCRGVAVIAGGLCLRATTADGATWSLDTVGPDLRTRRVVRLTTER